MMQFPEQFRWKDAPKGYMQKVLSLLQSFNFSASGKQFDGAEQRPAVAQLRAMGSADGVKPSSVIQSGPVVAHYMAKICCNDPVDARASLVRQFLSGGVESRHATNELGITEKLDHRQVTTSLEQIRKAGSARPAGNNLSAWRKCCVRESKGVEPEIITRHQTQAGSHPAALTIQFT